MVYELGIILAHELNKKEKLSEQTIERIEEGIKLYKKGFFKKIVVSGGHVKGCSFSISKKMKDHIILKDKKINSKEILLENISLDTVGQIIFLKEGIIDPLHIKKFCIITHSWHIPRTKFIANSFFNKQYKIKFFPVKSNLTTFIEEQDASKISDFVNLFIKKGHSKSSLINQLFEKHPWYNEKYPSKKFTKKYFAKNLEKLKKEIKKNYCLSPHKFYKLP